MEKRFLLFGFLSGIISGAIIGVLFNVIESITGVKVYRLLVNIYFIAIVGEIQFSEGIEFLFHLIVSVILTYILFRLFQRCDRSFIMFTVMSLLVGIV